MTAELIPYEDIKITHEINVDGEIISFTITDDKGTKYFFEDVERSEEVVDIYTNGWKDQTVTEYNSSWYLTRVENIYGERIEFSYDNETSQVSNYGGSKVSRYFNFSNLEDTNPSGNWNHSESYSSNNSSTFKRLSSISTSNELIEFEASNVRQDMPSSSNPCKAITKINIKHKTNPIKNIKSYSLNYTYFLSDSPPSTFNTQYKRLRLDNIFIKDKNEISKEKYTFNYNAITLPNRYSKKYDNWGYFNNSSHEPTETLYPDSSNQLYLFIPALPSKMYVYPSYSSNYRYQTEPNSNYPYSDSFVLDGYSREVNENYIQAGILNEIIYPTGGSVKYEYESNEYLYNGTTYKGGGVRIKTITKYDNLSEGSLSNLKLKESYTYKDENGITSGRVSSTPMLTNAFDKSILISVSSNSMNGLSMTNGGHVGYKTVTKHTNGIGKTIYKYSTPAMLEDEEDVEYGLYQPTEIKVVSSVDMNYGNWKSDYILNHLKPNTFPFPENTNYDWNRGKLKGEYIYDEFGNLIRETSYKYKIYNHPWLKDKIYGINYGYFLTNYLPQDAPYISASMTGISKYYLLTNMANVLESVETKEYTSN